MTEQPVELEGLLLKLLWGESASEPINIHGYENLGAALRRGAEGAQGELECWNVRMWLKFSVSW